MEALSKNALSSYALRRNLRQLDEERIGRNRRMALRALRHGGGYNAQWWLIPLVRLVFIGIWVSWVSLAWPELGYLLWQ